MRRGEKAQRVMAEFVNGAYGADLDTFIDRWKNEHPTLQQSFARVCLAFFEMMAGLPDRVDMRNEATVDLAQEIMEIPPSFP